MSLRGFHLLFIVLAFLCAGGFWGWTVWKSEEARELGAVVMGNFSGSLAILLFFYGIWFAIKKLNPKNA